MDDEAVQRKKVARFILAALFTAARRVGHVIPVHGEDPEQGWRDAEEFLAGAEKRGIKVENFE